jgi:hypothetical protein
MTWGEEEEEYLKDQLLNLKQTRTTIRMARYQPGTHLVKDGNGNLLQILKVF